MQTGVIGPRMTTPRSPDGVVADVADPASASDASAIAKIRTISR